MRKLLTIAAASLLLAGAAGVWFWLYGPCGTRRLDASLSGLRRQAQRFLDEAKIAESTPIIAIAGPLGRLNDVKRDTMDLDVPQCSRRARELLVQQMEILIEGMAAAAQAQIKGQRFDVDTVRSRAEEANTKFAAETYRLTECAPICSSY